MLTRAGGCSSAACCAHALHDGYTDLIYVLLPVWQAEFALSYAALGALRMLYTGAMAGLQMPASMLAARIGAPLLLALGTALAAGAYLTIGLSSAGFVLLAAALLAGGAGSSTQHPLASGLIARAYAGPGARAALGTYNFSGDLGKMAIPAALAWLLVLMPWRSALGLIGGVGLVVAAALLLLLPRGMAARPHRRRKLRNLPRAARAIARRFPCCWSSAFWTAGHAWDSWPFCRSFCARRELRRRSSDSR